jgi:nucleotide-binding universal stress UspA family protein
MDTKQVVVAYDFSDTADVALERAVDIACRAPDHVLHFIVALDARKGLGEGHVKVDFEYTEKIQARLLDRLHAAFERRTPAGPPTYFVHARIGHAIDEILDLADAVGADLILIGSHGRTGLKRFFLGSTSEAVVRRALCPVVVARPKKYAHIDLDTIVEVPDHPHRRRPAFANRAKVVGPMQWPT